MKRIFYPYHKWEDWQNGMYKTKVNNYEYLSEKCIELLSNNQLFFEIGTNMVNEWKVSALVNLTNLEQNRKAWIGQASCCYYANVPEYITCESWMKLTQKQRTSANNIAEQIIKNYERQINKTKQMLLEL